MQPINEADIKIVVQEEPLCKRLTIESGLDEEYVKQMIMQQQVDIFLFVNPRSGSKKGQRILDIGFSTVSFSLQPDLKGLGSVKVTMHIVNLLDPELKQKALREIKALQS